MITFYLRCYNRIEKIGKTVTLAFICKASLKAEGQKMLMLTLVNLLQICMIVLLFPMWSTKTNDLQTKEQQKAFYCEILKIASPLTVNKNDFSF